jgi:predicted ribosome quality control (RQC) complex YloA/Tae2 family protein
VPPLLEAVAGEIEHLEEMAVHVELADSEKAITSLRRELEGSGILREPKDRKKQARKGSGKASTPPGVYARLHLDGAEALVGGSAAGNERVTFDLARPEDLWLHARGVPGAHVILRTQDGEPAQDAIQAAAEIAAARSAARDATRVEVDYTLRKYVRKIRGGAPGRVTYRNERTIAVVPEQSEGAGLRPAPDDSLDAAGELVPELGLGHVADDPVDLLAALEEDHGRDASDVEASGERRVRVDVDLRDL